MITKCGGPRAGLILGAATTLAAVNGVVGIVGAGTAAAQPFARTFDYTCSSPVTGAQPTRVKIESNFPDSIKVGEPGRTISVDAVATVSAGVTDWLTRIGAQTLEGTANATAHVDGPQTDFDMKVPFRMARTKVPASGSFKVAATASVTTPPFSRPGKGTVTAGDLALHLVATNGSAQAWADAPCTLNANSSNFVKSFDITKPGSGASTAPRPTTGTKPPASHPGAGTAASAPPRRTSGSGPSTGSGRTSGPVAADVPKPATPAVGGAPTSGTLDPEASGPAAAISPTPVAQGSAEPVIARGAPATGLGVREFVLLAVGVLVACVGTFFLGMRLKARRGGDGGADGRRVLPERGPLPGAVESGRPDAPGHGNGGDVVVLGHQGRDARPVARAGGKVLGGQARSASRHVLHRVGRQGAGVRSCAGADTNGPLPEPLAADDADDMAVR